MASSASWVASAPSASLPQTRRHSAASRSWWRRRRVSSASRSLAWAAATRAASDRSSVGRAGAIRPSVGPTSGRELDLADLDLAVGAQAGDPDEDGAAPVAGERPRIVTVEAEREAHLRRLVHLRKKAGRALWDEVEPVAEAEPLPA